MKKIKTNAMRLLDQAGINYKTVEYEVDENNVAGEHVADIVGIPYERCFKTLVAKGEKNGIMVFCIPVNAELDLKKAANIVKDKKIEMVHVKDLLNLTGYIRGGCSPIGMKKKYPTFIDETAILFDEISVSAGTRGCQLILNPEELIEYIEATECDITVI
ncbi:Cys-tRNA(Pro) deacylase [Anaeromicropila herbilytica]|uniref:Cys-tRNA(Pro)/Cys-tRNA(Cys) deacylase n=1 Tax=Anaeromicropila herbilytica TaxID=2785025 RepID=A0A7R7IE44_9FIRM|nr:Cys-tRNA(Pro) deacylase [Anaeromicropila herbilytica]BCN30698.1 Cys-tRNA(Pro)/Cys-tRNA(Cys) deacylase [Anaeromicropila herbilytica]